MKRWMGRVHYQHSAWEVLPFAGGLGDVQRLMAGRDVERVGIGLQLPEVGSFICRRRAPFAPDEWGVGLRGALTACMRDTDAWELFEAICLSRQTSLRAVIYIEQAGQVEPLCWLRPGALAVLFDTAQPLSLALSL